jgi:glycerol-3-phosphate acyltransferase PlsY
MAALDNYFVLMHPAAQLAVVGLLGYLIGSIPFGLLLTRAAGLGDVRKIGSGNIGATNVLRTGNKKLAALTLLLDALKGTVAALLGLWIGAWISARLTTLTGPLISNPADVAIVVAKTKAQTFSIGAGLAAGLGAFLGHIFPVWLRFKGGKGVATYIGVLIGVHWPAALVFAVAWLATAALTRYSSLSALVATMAVFLFLMATAGPFIVPGVAVMSALLFWKHRENIRRLQAGTESKIGAKG